MSTNTILLINGSVQANSVTRGLTARTVEALNENGTATIIDRDLSNGLPLIDADWTAANFTAAEARSEEQNSTLAFSDSLVAEIEKADTLVIGMPIYNFTIPTGLRAWIDLIARARLTFRYTEEGPVGLMTGKKAYIVVASGGTKIGSDIDFATPYLRHALGFIGITDITIIDGSAGDIKSAETAIDDLNHEAA